VGDYNYRTTFNLTGLDLTTADIAGRWLTDNNGLDILINGNSFGEITGTLDSTFSDFSIPIAFLLPGLNTLDFLVHNRSATVVSNPTSLIVQFTTATADPTTPSVDVPEPATLTLFGASLAGLWMVRRRRAR
jgi:hypothetical protein